MYTLAKKYMGGHRGRLFEVWTSPLKELVVWEPEKIWSFVEKVSGNRGNKQSLVVTTLYNNMLTQKKSVSFQHM